MIVVRTATTADAEDIRQIYAPFVLSTAASFETQVPTVIEMEARIKKILQKFPWIVYEADAKVRGYTYATAYREREAYQWTCESSIYLHPDLHGKGIGKLLYEALFGILKIQGLVNVYGVITLPNEASTRLHEACGFEHFAVYDNVGYKLDSWQKVGWWKLRLNEYNPEPSPPLAFSQLDQQLVARQFEQAAASIQSRLTG